MNKITENDWASIEPVRVLVRKEIEDLENFPLTELQQTLINYLYANIDDIIDACCIK